MNGQILSDRYKIIRTLGARGMWQTYVAEDTQRPGNPKCVVKQLKPASTEPNFLVTARRLLVGEAEMHLKLGKNERIPQLLAHFERDGAFYMVQEFIDGQPLSAELPLGQRWSEAQVVALLKDILVILEFIHGKGVIHRDIKPDSIVRRQLDGKFVLIDFGAVKQVRMQQATTVGEVSVTAVIGTPGYMPTEQSSGKPRPSSDIYALGMVAIQALTGLLPSQLREDEDGEAIWRDQAEVSDGLAIMLTTMTRHYFKLRYKSASELLQAIQDLDYVSSNFEVKQSYSPTEIVNNSNHLPSEVLFEESKEPLKSPKIRYLKSKSLKKNEGSLGVSIGVSHSSAAMYKNGVVSEVVNIASTVAYTDDGRCFIGEEAIQEVTSNISTVFTDFIYYIGQSYKEINQFMAQPPYRIAKGNKDQVILECSALNQWFSPEDLLIELLCEILNQAGEKAEACFTQITLTIPTFLDSIFCREIIRHSAREAGIEKLKFLNESVASGVGASFKTGKLYESYTTCLVLAVNKYHINFNFLEIGDGVVEAINSVQRYVENGVFNDPEFGKIVIEAAESILPADMQIIDLMVLPISIAKSPAITAIYNQKLAVKAKEVLWSKNDAVTGATVQAGALWGLKKNFLILQATSLTLGIITKKGMCEIVSKNTTIPHKKGKIFLFKSSSSQLQIPIVEFESAESKKNNILGIINLGVTSNKNTAIEVIFDIDADNILDVTTVDKLNDNRKTLSIAKNELMTDDKSRATIDNNSLLELAIKGQAIWHGPGGDSLVFVEDFMGVNKEDIYLKIKDSDTGIKLDEVEFRLTDKS